MFIDEETVLKIAAAAYLSISTHEIDKYKKNLNDTLELLATLETSSSITQQSPMLYTNPAAEQRLRPDQPHPVSEQMLKDFKKIAPLMEEQLYLVPKVIE